MNTLLEKLIRCISKDWPSIMLKKFQHFVILSFLQLKNLVETLLVSYSCLKKKQNNKFFSKQLIKD